MSLLNTILPFRGRAQSRTTACHNENEPTIRPVYKFAENADASGWTLTVSLPGVEKSGLSITDEAGVLTIRGERAWKRPESWTTLHRESSDETFELAFRHDNEIDVEKIKADFANGVLTAALPKAEALKPRKIEVR